jgi:hypothetical protein
MARSTSWLSTRPSTRPGCLRPNCFTFWTKGGPPWFCSRPGSTGKRSAGFTAIHPPASEVAFPQPAGFQVRVLAGGLLASLLAGRRGRATSSPPQFGHLPARTVSAHVAQKVHSNEQIRASVESGGRSLLQHSQPGLSSSISMLPEGEGVSSINNEQPGTCACAGAMRFGIVSHLIACSGP